MPESKTILIYKLEELEGAPREHALGQLAEMETMHEWWENVYDSFQGMCDSVGISVDLKNTFFNGFSVQGQGAAFTASIDVAKLIGVSDSDLSEEIATTFPRIDLSGIDTPVLVAIEEGTIQFYASTAPAGFRNTDQKTEGEWHFDLPYCPRDATTTEGILGSLDALIGEYMTELGNWLFTCLRDEYEYITGEECLSEMAEANEYRFLENGETA